MLKKKKEMRAVDDALDFMKEEFRKRMEACDEREARFKDKQAEMKAMVRAMATRMHSCAGVDALLPLKGLLRHTLPLLGLTVFRPGRQCPWPLPLSTCAHKSRVETCHRAHERGMLGWVPVTAGCGSWLRLH
jgi:hypothetical protein